MCSYIILYINHETNISTYDTYNYKDMYAHLVATHITTYLDQLIQELLHPVSNHLMNCLWIQSPVKYGDLL